MLTAPSFTWQQTVKEEYSGGGFIVISVWREAENKSAIMCEFGQSGIIVMRHLVAYIKQGRDVPVVRFTDAELRDIIKWLLEAGRVEYELKQVPFVNYMRALGNHFQRIELAIDAQEFNDRQLAQLEIQETKRIDEDFGIRVDVRKHSSFNDFISRLDFDKEIPDEHV